MPRSTVVFFQKNFRAVTDVTTRLDFFCNFLHCIAIFSDQKLKTTNSTKIRAKISKTERSTKAVTCIFISSVQFEETFDFEFLLRNTLLTNRQTKDSDTALKCSSLSFTDSLKMLFTIRIQKDNDPFQRSRLALRMLCICNNSFFVLLRENSLKEVTKFKSVRFSLVG